MKRVGVLNAIINILYLRYVFLKALMFDKNECLGPLDLLFVPKICPVEYMIGIICIFSSSQMLGVKDCIFSVLLLADENLFYTSDCPSPHISNQPELILCYSTRTLSQHNALVFPFVTHCEGSLCLHDDRFFHVSIVNHA